MSLLWCNEVMISSATWTWRRSFAETVFDFIRHVAPWFYGNANRQAARSWQEGERKGAQTREWKASKEHTEIFFFFWYLALRRSQQVTQARTEKSKESQRPVCHRVTASHVSLRSLSFTGAGITLMPHVARYCPRLYEVKRRWEREREASLMPCTPAFLAQLIHYGSDSCLLS